MHGDKLLDDHRARRRSREDILLRFKYLSSWQDQYKTYEVIQGYFIHSGPGSERLRELRERAECVTAVARVAEHLGMTGGEVPGVAEYERARKELGIEPSAATIIRRWVVWREVCKAARGERVSQTARQRTQMRAAIKHRLKGEEWLAGLREWLESAPPSLCAADYESWADERNEKSPNLPPVRTAKTIYSALGLPWRVTVKVAQRDLTLAEAQARRMKKLKRDSGEFVTTNGVSFIRGITPAQARHCVQARTFPPYAFRLNRVRVWRRGDVEAHHRGEPFPKRKRGEMQHEIVASYHIMKLCGLTAKQLSEAIHRRSSQIPRPAGCVSKYHYWLRPEVEAWSESRAA
jgi:predicted DNA-binding transcriptional regulator AlpA